MATNARKLEGYNEISEAVLAETSIIKQVSSPVTQVQGSMAKGQTLKVYVNELATVADYVPGTGVSISTDGSNYVTLNNLKEKAVNELLDGYTIETAPVDYVAARFEASVASLGEVMDSDGFAKMLADGTVLGAGSKPVVATIYADVLEMKEALGNAKAPQRNRSLIVTPEMATLLVSPDAKIQLSTVRGDSIQAEGWLGRLAGFDIFESTLLPAGVNMIGLQERGFAHKDEYTREVRLQNLDGSGQFIGDGAIQGRVAYNSGAIRPSLILINNRA